MVKANHVALYTTIYPGVEKYLSAWYGSVRLQTDIDFSIWIGADELSAEDATDAIGAGISATWVIASKGETPAQIRQKAIRRMVDKYEIIIFVDSDDILEPTRVEAARKYLEQSDVNGCAMRLISEDGSDLGMNFSPKKDFEIATLLPHKNVLGLSNTAYRSQILKQCLPIPSDCILVDWYLATRAWLLGARISFDFTNRMAYRQHPANTARVLPPFTSEQVLAATEYVLRHFECVLRSIEQQSQSMDELETAFNYATSFYKAIVNSPAILRHYVRSLNQSPTNHVWWDYIADPELEVIWRN